jgi:predicted ATPase
MSVQKPNRHFVKAFQIKHFRGIADSGRVQLAPGAPWVFITGENGFGKTSVLQALAVGLSGKKIKKGDQTINLLEEAELLVQTGEKEYTGRSGKFGYPAVFGYGSARLELASEDKFAANPIYSLFETRSRLRNVEAHLASWYHKRLEYEEFRIKFETTKGILCALLGLADLQVDKDDQVTYIDQDPDGRRFAPVPFAGLASGFKNVVAVVGDLITRFIDLPGSQWATDLAEPGRASFRGIAIIDEFDLHLHPKWQRRLPNLLSKIFPQVQFIVSTHSPVPLLGAPPGSTFLKVTRNTETGITVQNLDYVEVKNLTPNTILTSPIFDLDDLSADEVPLGDLRTEDDYQEVVFDKILDKKLAEISQRGKNRFGEILNPKAK